MSANLRKWIPILQFICEINDEKIQKILLKYYSKRRNFNLALREIYKNVIKGNVKLTKFKRDKLRKKRKNLYSIAYDKNLNSNLVQRNLNQIGGSLFYIIPLIASLLSK